jgi:hypothetical protein
MNLKQNPEKAGDVVEAGEDQVAADEPSKIGNASKFFREYTKIAESRVKRRNATTASLYRQHIDFEKHETLEETQRSGKTEGRGQ